MTNREAGCYIISTKTMPTRFPVPRWLRKTPSQFLPLFFLIFLSSAFAQNPSPSADRALKEPQQAFERDDFATAARGFEQVRRAAPEKKEAWQGLVLS